MSQLYTVRNLEDNTFIVYTKQKALLAAQDVEFKFSITPSTQAEEEEDYDRCNRDE